MAKKKTIHCRECGAPTAEVTVEDQSRNGVRVIVTRYRDGGTYVDASCSCFGSTSRTHSWENCPNRLRLLARTATAP